MVHLVDLWLPILLSGVIVFFASSILHMVLPLHASDFTKVPGEADLQEVLRNAGVKPGQYMFPHCDGMKGLGEPEMQEKFIKGPVGVMNVIPSGPPSMGKNLAQWFGFCILISIFVGYVASFSMDAGRAYMEVFRLTGTVAIVSYGISGFPDAIWKGGSWATAMKFAFDGLVYGLLTAGVFSWLWPAAA